MEKIEQVSAGGVVLGQVADDFHKLPKAVKERMVMDITANTLMQEARNALFRAGNLLAMEVRPEGALEPVWIDQEANIELATRIEVALRILAGQEQAEIVVPGA